MIINLEAAACYGRGFSEVGTGGFLEHFYDWVTRAPVATPVVQTTGGPGWYIIDDQSAAVNPYIVVSNHTIANIASDPNRYDVPHKIMKIGYVSTVAAYVLFETYLWYDVAAHQGYARYSTKRISTYDEAGFAYRFAGGPEQMMISSRIGTVWESFFFGEWEGDANLVQPVTTVGVLQSGILAGDHVVLQLAAGQAANFTEGYYCYIYNFDGQNQCNYVLIEDVDPYTDQITINHCTHNFPADSVIGSYVHRFFTAGTREDSVAAGGAFAAIDKYRVQIPYYSRYGYEMKGAPTTQIYAAATGQVLENVLGSGTSVPTTPGMAPDDRNYYAVERPLIGEYRSHQYYTDSTSMNRYYGAIKNMYCCCLTNMLQMVDGRRINSLNHVYGEQSGRWANGSYAAVLVPDYDSVV